MSIGKISLNLIELGPLNLFTSVNKVNLDYRVAFLQGELSLGKSKNLKKIELI